MNIQIYKYGSKYKVYKKYIKYKENKNIKNLNKRPEHV